MKIIDKPFVFIANHIALDFVNTEIVLRSEKLELLQEGADLLSWAQQANLRLGFKCSPADLGHIHDLRSAIKNIFQAKIDKQTAPSQSLAVLNRYLADYSSPQVLQGSKNKYQLLPLVSNLSRTMLLGFLAHEAATLLSSPQAQRLKKCHNQDCVLLFLDVSRSQKRRWCSMEICGNRAKATTHYKKTHSLQ